LKLIENLQKSSNLIDKSVFSRLWIIAVNGQVFIMHTAWHTNYSKTWKQFKVVWKIEWLFLIVFSICEKHKAEEIWLHFQIKSSQLSSGGNATYYCTGVWVTDGALVSMLGCSMFKMLTWFIKSTKRWSCLIQLICFMGACLTPLLIASVLHGKREVRCTHTLNMPFCTCIMAAIDN